MPRSLPWLQIQIPYTAHGMQPHPPDPSRRPGLSPAWVPLRLACLYPRLALLASRPLQRLLHQHPLRTRSKAEEGQQLQKVPLALELGLQLAQAAVGVANGLHLIPQCHCLW